MLCSEECLERAAELERQAQEAESPGARADYLMAAEGWRDLARRTAAVERGERGNDPLRDD